MDALFVARLADDLDEAIASFRRNATHDDLVTGAPDCPGWEGS